jgi:hypothetical protein
MADTRQGVDTERLLVRCEFHVEDEYLHASDLVELMNALTHIVGALRDFSTPFARDPLETATLGIVQLVYGSPLSILLTLGGAPRRLVRRLVGVFRYVVLYREERSRREAMAHLKWEELRAARLANLAKAIELASEVDDLTSGEMDAMINILDYVDHMDNLPLTLKTVSVEEER